MVFSVTERTQIDMVVNGVSGVTPVAVVDLSTVQTLVAAVTDKVIAVVGWLGVDGTAQNITFYSGSDSDVTLELGANSGAIRGIGNPIYVTQPGAALKAASSGTISSMLLYVQICDPIMLRPGKIE